MLVVYGWPWNEARCKHVLVDAIRIFLSIYGVKVRPATFAASLYTVLYRLASFPGLHAQLLSLAVRKAGEGLDRFIT